MQILNTFLIHLHLGNLRSPFPIGYLENNYTLKHSKSRIRYPVVALGVSDSEVLKHNNKPYTSNQ
ncbi:hypothetical protein PL11201_170118 [Planktothrix sp. PCC 11201]|nr:hypothetical protein PL11201_170118 [Planktothrix sp. PCC 11201]